MTVTPATRYRALVADLVTASRRYETALTAAGSSHADGTATIDHDLVAADDAVIAATARAAHAQRLVAQTDLAAGALWDELKQVRGRRGRRLGPVPGPVPLADQPPTPSPDPIGLLEAAAARIDRARHGGEKLPPLILPVLFALGAACAALVALLAVFLQGHGPFGLLAGWLALLGAPLSGLLPARELADHRYGARLDPGAIGLIILAGMLATAAVTLS